MTDPDRDPDSAPASNNGADTPSDRGADAPSDPGDPPHAAADGSDLPAWLPDPVLAYRVEDVPTVTAVSWAFEGTFDVGTVAGRSVETALSSTVGDVDEAVEAVEGDTQYEGVVRSRDAEGASGYLLRVVPPSATGSGRGYLLFTDVTDLRERVAGLAAERDRLAQFASVVAHDVQNPIGTARLRIRTAREDPEDVHFEKALGAIDRMESILQDALRLVREGQFVDELEAVDLATAVEAAWTTVEGGEPTLAVGEELPTVAADPGPLRELLENLFHNAVEHGGTDVTIAVAARPGGFAVVDDGPGIAPEDREAVFEPGYSGADGTGLGLAIVERIAQDHGWTVSVTDGPDGGCEIRVTGVECV